jgi:hypothetical protein
VRRHRFKETAEPSMFDDIQTIRFASNDKIGKAFGVLNENLCLCLICDEVFTRQGAAQHSFERCCPFPPISVSRPTFSLE